MHAKTIQATKQQVKCAISVPLASTDLSAKIKQKNVYKHNKTLITIKNHVVLGNFIKNKKKSHFDIKQTHALNKSAESRHNFRHYYYTNLWLSLHIILG